ncbi:MAG: transporter substrate-binding domain-containing protein [Bdellovibrio sp.]|nr:transporter substrate-binding domain-containing protein [Bdellovibrio sp.]
MQKMILIMSLLFATLAYGKSVRILVEDNWPPFAAVQHGRPMGLSIDLVRAALKLENTELELVQVPYLRCLALTEMGGKEAGCFNSAKNEDLLAKYTFPNEYLFRSRGMIVGNRLYEKQLNRSVRSVRDLEGKTVALPSGFPFGKEFDDNKKIHKYFTANDMTSLKLVESGRVKYAAIDEMVLYYYLERNPSLKESIVQVIDLTNEPIYVHLSKTHPDSAVIKEKLDRGLAALKNSQEYGRLLQKYFGKDVPVEKFK